MWTGRGVSGFLKWLYARFALRNRNLGWGYCRWNCTVCQCHRYKQIILLDEGMCHPCYESYCEDYK